MNYSLTFLIINHVLFSNVTPRIEIYFCLSFAPVDGAWHGQQLFSILLRRFKEEMDIGDCVK